MRLLLILTILLTLISLNSIALNLPVSASQNACSGLTLLHQSPSSYRSNPALQINGIETSVTQLFGLSELPFYSFHISKSFSRLGIGIGSSCLDNQLYQELVSALAINYSFDDLQVGIGLNYISEKATGFKKLAAFSFDAGVSWQLKSFRTAVSIKNLSEAELEGTKLPVYFVWESCWEYSGMSRLSFGLEKEKGYDFSFKFGSLYQLNSRLGVIGSYQFEPHRIGAGAIFTVKKYEVVYSFRTHKQLDMTHYVSLSYNY